ncbi:GIY-YIG nuclease family protein [Vibrio parahaemolyticus]|uniref:GIY-YIG nuclease family protein n=1 Tax=Vibrio parahaemolyticus TaxID=670 RepID=UPI00112144A8|nr:hypothetical protein CGJ03_23265 [Vibrio parahaemolyticus]
MCYYVYLLQEYPLESTPHCKVGFSKNPLKRLEQLQSGNPRYLRPYPHNHQKPKEDFGIWFEQKETAVQFETELLERLSNHGVRISRDSGGKLREWVECCPELVWGIMIEMLPRFLPKDT